MGALQGKIGHFRYLDAHRPGSGRDNSKLTSQKRSSTPRLGRSCKMPSSPALLPVFGKDRNTHDGDVEALQQEYRSIHQTAQVF